MNFKYNKVSFIANAEYNFSSIVLKNINCKIHNFTKLYRYENDRWEYKENKRNDDTL